MGTKKKPSGTKAKLKAIKRLARRTRVPATKVHEPRRKKKRGDPRGVEELLRQEGWE